MVEDGDGGSGGGGAAVIVVHGGGGGSGGGGGGGDGSGGGGGGAIVVAVRSVLLSFLLPLLLLSFVAVSFDEGAVTMITWCCDTSSSITSANDWALDGCLTSLRLRDERLNGGVSA